MASLRENINPKNGANQPSTKNAPAPLLSVRSLNFSYKNDESFALCDINLDIKPGEVCAILGKNGSGKSSLLGCLAGVFTPKSGSISIQGRDLVSLKPNERAKLVAFVPQVSVQNELSVYDTIMLGRRPYMTISASMQDHMIVGRTIDELNLGGIAAKSTDNLSGGEFQKTCIARALAQRCPLLLLDEPTNNLDVQNQHEIFEIISKLSEKDIGIVCIIHDINLAIKYADKLVFMRDGQIVNVGCPDIVSKPLLREIYGIDAHIFQENNNKYVVI